MGLKVGTVYLEDYNEKWKDSFEEEKKILEKILGKIALRIEHVGSTSIQGLKSKPIIDIMVVLERLSDFELVRKFFEKVPYSIKLDSPDDEILVRKGSEENRTHFIHVVEENSARCKNTLLFRDYLRKHEDVRNDYEELKTKLAKEYENDRKMYTASKNEFIQNVLKMAKEN